MNDTASRRSRPLSLGVASAAPESLPQLAGVIEVHPLGPNRFQITYDLEQIGYGVLCERFEALGIVIARSWKQRWRRFWYGYLDATAQANLRQGQKLGCCSNPTEVYARRKR